MNRTIILFVLFLLLGAGTFMYLQNDKGKTTITGSDKDFSVDNIDDVYKVFLADRTGNKTTLTRENDHWKLNGTHRANANIVENLLDVIKRVKVKYLSPDAAKQTMVTDLATNGIKVEIYNKANELLKAYYVGGMTNNEMGTYMMLEGADRPHITHMPGWEGGLRARFIMRPEQWRDRTVIRKKVEDIKAVSMEYPKQKNKSFKLEKEGNEFKVKPFYEVNQSKKMPAIQGKVEAYLVGFGSLMAEGFKNDHKDRDSISQTIPFGILKLTDVNDQVQEIRFHPILNFKNGQLITDDMVVGSNTSIERYFANVVGGDFFLVQHLLFQKVFWSYESFY